MTRCSGLFLLCAMLGSAPALAASKPKVAVLILGTGVEPDLADNLTEVVIAKVARLGNYDLAGKEEFRGKLGVEDDRRALACVDDLACLGRAGAALAVTKVLAGTIGKRDQDYLFSLSLYDLQSGKTENRIFKLVPGGVQGLIKVVEEAAVTIFERRPDPGNVRVEWPVRSARVYIDDAFVGATPVRTPPLEAGKHRLRVEAEDHLGFAREIEIPSGGTLDITLPENALPAQRRWPKYMAWTTLGVAALSAAAGGFLAVLSQESPTGMTRAEQLADLDHKSSQATTANILFASAGALALTSGALFYFYRQDIFGGTVTVAGTVTPTGQVVAAARW